MNLSAEQLGMSPAEYALMRLMSRDKIPWKCKLKSEELMAVELADALRRATLDGKLHAVWCHVPNEGKRHPFVAIIMKAMGMLPGSLDYWFIWENGGGLIELKSGKNKPSEFQEYFITWCEQRRVNKAVCYSVDSALEVLRGWGVLKTVCPPAYCYHPDTCTAKPKVKGKGADL